MRIYKTLGLGVLIVALVGCQDMGTGEKVGTVGGAVAGGLIGTQIGGGTGNTVAIIGGTLGGALLGGAVGRNYDRNQGN